MSHIRSLGGVLALLLVLGVQPAAAPPATAQTQPRGYVGEVTAAGVPDALIAIVVGANNDVAVFTCSKDDAWNQRVSKWFDGLMYSDGSLNVSAADGNEVDGQLRGSQLFGSVGGFRSDGFVGAPRFSANQVTNGTAGLYRGRVGDDILAVIEAPDGRRVGCSWSVTTGAHSGTWDFSTATALQTDGGLQVQRDQPQFIVAELRFCTNASCE
jgi:hypothetical protein